MGKRTGRTEPRVDKLKLVKELEELLKKYPVIGMLNLHKMPAAALQAIKSELYDEAKIRIFKKDIVLRAFGNVSEKKILLDGMPLEPALLFSETNPFKIYKFISQKKTRASAKPGDIAPEDIVVSAGPTELPPGPAISALTKVKIPAKVDGGKIGIVRDATVLKAGEEFSMDLVSALGLLKIQPMEIGLDVAAILEDGIVYGKDVLAVDYDQVLLDLVLGYHQGVNLSVEAGYPTKDSIELMIIKAFREARGLSLEAGVISADIIGDLLAKAVREASELEKLVPEIEESKEENAETAEKTPTEAQPPVEKVDDANK